jgi:hypothetical protein
MLKSRKLEAVQLLRMKESMELYIFFSAFASISPAPTCPYLSLPLTYLACLVCLTPFGLRMEGHFGGADQSETSKQSISAWQKLFQGCKPALRWSHKVENFLERPLTGLLQRFHSLVLNSADDCRHMGYNLV